MNFDHWKDVLNEETPAPDYYRAYVDSATDPRKRKRGARAKLIAAEKPTPNPSEEGSGRGLRPTSRRVRASQPLDALSGSGTGVPPVRTETHRRDACATTPVRGQGERWIQPAGMEGGTTRPAVLIPKAPGYTPAPGTEPADAFIPPRQGVFVRVQAQEELV